MIRLDPVPVEAPRKIFIMAGQSNMVGHGVLDDLPGFPAAPQIFMYRYNEDWAPGAEPMSEHTGIVYSVFYDDDDKASCGMAFANALCGLTEGFEVGLVPCAKGGSGMASWGRNLSTASLYGAMIARVNAALSHPYAELGGLIWYQGEEDAQSSTNASLWASRFEQFVSDVRSDLSAPGLPVVWTRLGPNGQSRPYWTTVQAQQASASVTNGACVDASDLSVLDGVHLDTASLVTLGGRYATAMNAML